MQDNWGCILLSTGHQVGTCDYSWTNGLIEFRLRKTNAFKSRKISMECIRFDLLLVPLLTKPDRILQKDLMSWQCPQLVFLAALPPLGLLRAPCMHCKARSIRLRHQHGPPLDDASRTNCWQETCTRHDATNL